MVTVPSGADAWPAVAYERRSWHWQQHGARPPRADRTLGDYQSAVPPSIGQRAVRLGRPLAETARAAEHAIVAFDVSAPFDLSSLAGALLRSESVASSKIEQLDVSQRDLGIALLGESGASTAAAQVAANVAAMTTALRLGEVPASLNRTDLLALHRELMSADRHATSVGRFRDVPSWIGGSDYSPRDALFVPPHPQLLEPLIDDLVRFMYRTDVPALVHAAIVHAHFETLHPFDDGNGRAGRALIHTLLRRGQLATRAVVPVSTVLLADVGGYFAGLDAYRDGDLAGWLTRFAAAASSAAVQGGVLAAELVQLRDSWRQAVRPRSGSAVAVLLDEVLRQPVVDIAAVRRIVTGVSDPNLYRALDRLVDAGVVDEVTGYGRNRVWAATSALDAVEHFEARLGRRELPA